MLVLDSLEIRFPIVFCGYMFKSRTKINKLLTQIRGAAKKGLHLGAGAEKIENLINCDLYHEEADQKVDALSMPEFEKGSVDYIESHHMLEHFDFSETEKALNEWSRVLKKKGVLVLTIPDIDKVCLLWLIAQYNPFTSQERKDYLVKMFVGPQNYEGMIHKNIYNKARIEHTLKQYGFRVLFTYSRHPRRPTPSLLVIAEKN